MTRSTGTSGLIFVGSPPSFVMPSRIAARSTTAGTPVKSCISTRAGRKPISFSVLPLLSSQLGHRRDVGLGDRTSVLVAQEVFEQNLHRIGQLRDAGEAVGLGVGQRIVNVALAVDVKGLAAVEAVVREGFWALKVRPPKNVDEGLRRRSAGGSRTSRDAADVAAGLSLLR